MREKIRCRHPAPAASQHNTSGLVLAVAGGRGDKRKQVRLADRVRGVGLIVRYMTYAFDGRMLFYH